MFLGEFLHVFKKGIDKSECQDSTDAFVRKPLAMGRLPGKGGDRETSKQTTQTILTVAVGGRNVLDRWGSAEVGLVIIEEGEGNLTVTECFHLVY